LYIFLGAKTTTNKGNQMTKTTKAKIAIKAAEIIGYKRLAEVNFKLAMTSMEIIKNEEANDNKTDSEGN
jgi:hypothetical protein